MSYMPALPHSTHSLRLIRFNNLVAPTEIKKMGLAVHPPDLASLLRVIPDSLIYLLVTVRAVPAESAPRGNKFSRSATSCEFWLPALMGLIVDVVFVDLISCVCISSTIPLSSFVRCLVILRCIVCARCRLPLVFR